MFDCPEAYNMTQAQYQSFQRELYAEELNDLSLPHRRDAIIDDPDEETDED